MLENKLAKIPPILKKINPDAICLFGDRSETFIISFVAYSLEIPIIHFSGGEITESVFIEFIFYPRNSFVLLVVKEWSS